MDTVEPTRLDTINLELTALKEAKNTLIAGKSLTQVSLGSNDFQRIYKYQKLTLAEINSEILKLELEKQRLVEGTNLVFRSACLPLRVCTNES